MIGVVGAGAFGTALAVTLARHGAPVTLWARDTAQFFGRMTAGPNAIMLPESVSVTADMGNLDGADAVLVCLPMQVLGGFMAERAASLNGQRLVACCKGIDVVSGRGPTAIIASACPASTPAVLTGPGFAADIALGLPTALTLACMQDAEGASLQRRLSTATLRLYRTTDVIGAEMGGALKNVVAIAAGVVIGARLGCSARAAVITRGYAEMQRLALARGARGETLAGLSGLGDLVLTCTSTQSRNFRFGHALATGVGFDPKVTVEGVATARAVMALARAHAIDAPIAEAVTALVDGGVTVPEAITTLLSRPLKQE